MKRGLKGMVFIAGVIVLITPLLIFYGCAKKQLIKPETTEETQGEGAAEGSAQGAKEGEGRLPEEGKIGEEKLDEEALKGEALSSRVQEEMLDINFEFDQFMLTDTARQKLSKNVSILSKYSDVKVLIEGHCDERGTEEYNLALGERRANAAKEYMVTLGINESRLSTISYGEEKPLDPEHSDVAWAKNRRVHFEIVTK